MVSPFAKASEGQASRYFYYNTFFCSILKIVRTPVVKQSLLRGTAHFGPRQTQGEPACQQAGKPPRLSACVPAQAGLTASEFAQGRRTPARVQRAGGSAQEGSRTDACPVPILGKNSLIRRC
ncbi:MAG: hypothetical protein A3A28_01825 [Candidatus Sungbacteria bacterium RIFCSPLOWO2_01_FULL_47_32]|uniref:Uncharacterized protein n=1 Tax=Candidatus Sungbacteria bacterium RIFCSPHIGHO2_01_FULL_47_32 TaxID=1802264 RepID=A0A1G2K7U9_9BACT|nr:MAG: hypothetical protein A2633_05370 [Candidatus Sungbacteria bacterium RIFCSPHIGHO2_01_FULL_47_32]OHA05090.1 MAG: hypothetical protein A3A28_01825 [Candidatus Sungbacteria bacterium RIFCSPLOWO2_01_FULL_47_32]